jgi:hypothetical protein
MLPLSLKSVLNNIGVVLKMHFIPKYQPIKFDIHQIFNTILLGTLKYYKFIARKIHFHHFLLSQLIVCIILHYLVIRVT